jgi:hypothetical protein
MGFIFANGVETTMMGLEDIRKDNQLASAIDWDMTPEEAVTLYLEFCGKHLG